MPMEEKSNEAKEPKLSLLPDEIQATLAAEVPTIQQFKNSLKFVQGGTNLSLERMVDQLDIVAAQCYLAGVQAGIAYAKETNDKAIGELSKERDNLLAELTKNEPPNPPVTLSPIASQSIGTFRPAGEEKK